LPSAPPVNICLDTTVEHADSIKAQARTAHARNDFNLIFDPIE
jgi:hypothetical protein